LHAESELLRPVEASIIQLATPAWTYERQTQANIGKIPIPPHHQYPSRLQNLDALPSPTQYAPAELETPPAGMLIAGAEDVAMFEFDLAAQNFERK
jgi:hypothetical protein